MLINGSVLRLKSLVNCQLKCTLPEFLQIKIFKVFNLKLFLWKIVLILNGILQQEEQIVKNLVMSIKTDAIYI